MSDPDTARDAPAPRRAWSPIEVLPVTAIAISAFIILASFASLLDLGPTGTFVIGGILLELCFGLVSLGWIRLRHPDSIGALGLPRDWVREAGLGAVGGVATYAISFVFSLVVLVVIERLGGTPNVPEQIPGEARGAGLSLVGFVAIVMAPLGEELFFRGFMFRAFRSRAPFWVAAGVSSILFGLVHVVGDNFLLVPSLTVVGLCLAWLYERTGRILVPIVAHMAFNTIGFAFLTL